MTARWNTYRVIVEFLVVPSWYQHDSVSVVWNFVSYDSLHTSVVSVDTSPKVVVTIPINPVLVIVWYVSSNLHSCCPPSLHYYHPHHRSTEMVSKDGAEDLTIKDCFRRP